MPSTSPWKLSSANGLDDDATARSRSDRSAVHLPSLTSASGTNGLGRVTRGQYSPTSTPWIGPFIATAASTAAAPLSGTRDGRGLEPLLHPVATNARQTTQVEFQGGPVSMRST